MVWPSPGSSTKRTGVPSARSRAANRAVAAGSVIRSAVPWTSRTERPASWVEGSLGGSHGARPATAVTAGWPPTRKRRPATHGVPDQADRPAGEPLGQLVESPGGVGDR